MTVALIPCTDCMTQLSRRALACPRCGAPGPSPAGRVSHHPAPVPRAAPLLAVIAARVVAAAAGLVAASTAYLVFALFAADLFLGRGGAGNLWEVLALGAATALPIGGTVWGFVTLRRLGPGGRAARGARMAGALTLACVLSLGLYLFALGFLSVLEFLQMRGDLRWTAYLALATAVLVFLPGWLWWATFWHTDWAVRIGVSTTMALLAYGGGHLLWVGLELLASQRGIATGTMSAMLPAFALVSALCLHGPVWIHRATRRSLRVAVGRKG